MRVIWMCLVGTILLLGGCDSQKESSDESTPITSLEPMPKARKNVSGAEEPKAEKETTETVVIVAPVSRASTDCELLGRVTDEAGSPVSNAEIRVEPAVWDATDSSTPTLGMTRSGTSGDFRIVVQPLGGRAVVSATKVAFYLKSPARLMLEAGAVHRDISLVLIMQKEAAGTVMDAAGKPIYNATITTREVPSTVWKNTISGPDGRFGFPTVNSGASVTLQAWADGYTTATKTVSSAELENLSVVLLPQIRGTFTGWIWDQASNPITTATILSADGRDVNRSSRGANAFEIPNIAHGEKIRLLIFGDGYGTYDSGPITMPDGKTTEERHFRLGTGGIISGRVVSKDSPPKPISSIRVFASAVGSDNKVFPVDAGPELHVYTGNDGRFELPPLAQGTWTITAVQETTKYEKSRGGVAVSDNQNEYIGDISLGEIVPGNVNMKVLRLPEKTGVGGIQVILWKSSTSEVKQTTAADGTVSFSNLSPGYYIVLVPDFEMRSAVSVLEGEPTKDIVLFVGAGELRGKVTDAQGESIQARISAESSSARKSKQAVTGDDGSFVITGVPPGMWDVTVNSGNNSILEQVQIKAGDTSEHVFRFPGGKITGTVVDKAGGPVSGAAVSVSYRPPLLPLKHVVTLSRSDGSFLLESLPAGAYRVDGVKKGVVTVVGHVDNVELGAAGDAKPIRLELSGEGGTLESYVYEMANGKPLPAAWCHLASGSTPYAHSSKRDDGGKMMVRDLPPGKYTVQIGAYSYSNVEREVEIRAGEVTSIQDVLYAAGALKLLVLNGDGMPAVGVDVELESVDSSSIEESKTGQTDLRGVWLYRGLSPGRYSLKVKSRSGQQRSSIVIEASGVTTLQVVLP